MLSGLLPDLLDVMVMNCRSYLQSLLLLLDLVPHAMIVSILLSIARASSTVNTPAIMEQW